MTATQAQAAANPATAEQQDPASEDVTDAETDGVTGSSAAAQQQAYQISTVPEQPNAELLQSECDGISRGEHAAEGCQGRGNEHDSLAGAEILIIENAAELTCDRAAVILRQLSSECQAAESCARKPEATCSTSAADEEQQYAALNQMEADCQSAACRTDAKASAAALLLPAGAQLLPDKADRPEEEVPEVLLDQAERRAERPEEQVSELHQGQTSVSGSAVHAAGVHRDLGRALSLQGGHASTSREVSSASLGAGPWQANPGRGVSHDAVCPSREQGSDCPASSSGQPPAQQGVSSSSFLQRLQMSKHAAASSLNATYHQAEDSRQGEQLLRLYAGLPVMNKSAKGLVLLCLRCKLSSSKTGTYTAGCSGFGKTFRKSSTSVTLCLYLYA